MKGKVGRKNGSSRPFAYDDDIDMDDDDDNDDYIDPYIDSP